MNDRLQQLALFVRTVETGSFSRAAREFGLTQPSASCAVAALEERLGVKLILRTTRQVFATGAGEALLARARDALAAIEDAENAARGADRLSGVLRVALPTTYGARRIAPLLPAFLDRHPPWTIDLMMPDRYENLIAEGAELALRVGEQPDSSCVARKLGSARRLRQSMDVSRARRSVGSAAGMARESLTTRRATWNTPAHLPCLARTAPVGAGSALRGNPSGVIDRQRLTYLHTSRGFGAFRAGSTVNALFSKWGAAVANDERRGKDDLARLGGVSTLHAVDEQSHGLIHHVDDRMLGPR